MNGEHPCALAIGFNARAQMGLDWAYGDATTAQAKGVARRVHVPSAVS